MLIKILPPIIIFFVGYTLKQLKIFQKTDGDTLLSLVFYVVQPAAILISVSTLRLEKSLLYLPFIAPIISIIIMGISYLLLKKLKLARKTEGSFLVGTAIMNTGFVLPFIVAAFGAEGLARISLLDVGNAAFVFSFVYFIATLYGNEGIDRKLIIKKILLSPPLWALIFALILNFTHTNMPSVLMQTLQLIAAAIIPLLMLSIGIYFNPKIVNISKVVLAVLIRIGLGFLLAYGITVLLGLEGTTKAVVIIGASGPIGYNTLTFSRMEKLDEEFTASIISFSVIISLILIPALLILLKV